MTQFVYLKDLVGKTVSGVCGVNDQKGIFWFRIDNEDKVLIVDNKKACFGYLKAKTKVVAGKHCTLTVEKVKLLNGHSAYRTQLFEAKP